MQDEIVSRLANTLNAQLIEAEARRAERSLHPDAMDLYFQGMAWLNKGMTPEYLAQARSFFERALALDPSNIEALVGTAMVDAKCAVFCTDDRAARLAAAEAALIKALSLAPQPRLGPHWLLGVVQILTNRAAQGIAECERALALDRNLANAHAYIGLAKIFWVAARKPRAHIHEALRLSPRDTAPSLDDIRRASPSCSSAPTRKQSRGSAGASKPTEIIHARISISPPRWRCSARWMRRGAAAQAGLALDPSFHHPPLPRQRTERQSNFPRRTRAHL